MTVRNDFWYDTYVIMCWYIYGINNMSNGINNMSNDRSTYERVQQFNRV